MGVYTESGLTWSTAAPDFSPDEIYHARLPYRVLRRGQPLCSTPVTGCDSHGASFLTRPGPVRVIP